MVNLCVKFSEEYLDEYCNILTKKVFRKINNYKKNNYNLIKNNSEFLNFIEEIYCNVDIFLIKRIDVVLIFLNLLIIKYNLSGESKKVNDFFNCVFKYDDIISKDKKFAYQHFKKIDIEICPYCNKNDVECIYDGDDTYYRASFDHFYSKSKYPFLSLNIYNLVPCCSSCNMIKSNIDFNTYDFFYPFIDSDESSFFSFNLNEDLSYCVSNCSNNRKIINNFETLKIIEKYNSSFQSNKEINNIKNIIDQFYYNIDYYENVLNKKIYFNDLFEFDVKNERFGKLKIDAFNYFLELSKK